LPLIKIARSEPGIPTFPNDSRNSVTLENSINFSFDYNNIVIT